MIFEGDVYEEDEEIQMEDLKQAPPKFEDTQPQVLPYDLKEGIIAILHEFKVCFAWNYDKMLRLDRSLVEHHLPIKLDFHPFQQPPKIMSKEVVLNVKVEIKKLLKAKLIRPTKYVRWLTNIVHVMKKNRKIRVCVEFRDFNAATPKDIYVMPITDMLVDSTPNNELLSFVEGFFGYNQILVVVDDISKTAFRCPGSLGIFA